MNPVLYNKVVLISGATSMIGTAIARLFSENGAKLILLGRSEEKLKRLANELNTKAAIYAVDNIADSNLISEALSNIITHFKRIDCLIQNTAIYPYKTLEDLDLSSWNETLAVTLTAPFLILQHCIPILRKQNQGKVIFISSIAGEVVGLPNMAAFSAAKAGLNGLMRSAAIELASSNINVNSISPGKVYDMNLLSQDEISKKLSSVPLNRFIKSQDIADMALFLASEQANNITGQNFIIDGGQSVLAENAHIGNR
jgi:3-oxoacyl-[acyl-carrier protein] reductase